MRRHLIYIVILGLMLMAPLERMDVAQLEPVEVVFLAKEGQMVCLATDTEASGRGATAEEALVDMQRTTPGAIYLDTAEYLLVSEDALEQIDGLRGKLKGSVKLCAGRNVQIKEIARYLESHGNLPRLREWKTGDPLPVLQGKKILKNIENNP